MFITFPTSLSPNSYATLITFIYTKVKTWQVMQ